MRNSNELTIKPQIKFNDTSLFQQVISTNDNEIGQCYKRQLSIESLADAYEKFVNLLHQDLNHSSTSNSFIY